MTIDEDTLASLRDNWALIGAVPRPSKVVPFPRNGADGKPVCDVRIVLLTQLESMAAIADAEAATKKQLREALDAAGVESPSDKKKVESGSKAATELYELAAQAEILWRCCKHPDDPKMIAPFFRRKSDVLSELWPDEVAVLANEYAIFRSVAGPQVSMAATEEEFNKLVDAIAEGGERYPFGKLSWGALIQSLTLLARQSRDARRANSSSGTPQGELSSG